MQFSTIVEIVVEALSSLTNLPTEDVFSLPLHSLKIEHWKKYWETGGFFTRYFSGLTDDSFICGIQIDQDDGELDIFFGAITRPAKEVRLKGSGGLQLTQFNFGHE